MTLSQLINSIKAMQEHIIRTCNTMISENDNAFETKEALELCGFIDNSLKNVTEAQTLSDIQDGFNHAIFLFAQINRIAVKCEDADNQYALSIYRSTCLSSDIHRNIKAFIG